MGYLCDTHPDTPGALLITNLDTGDTAVCCGNCVHPWAAAIAAATAPDTLDQAIDLEPSDPVTGDPTHDDGAGDADPTPELVPPAPSPQPDLGDDPDGDAEDWPFNGHRDAVEAATRADAQERAASDA